MRVCARLDDAMDRVSYASSADDEMSKAFLVELQKLAAQAGGLAGA